jgi:hypothetical protein
MVTKGISLAYGDCSCLMPDEKRHIARALEESIKNEKVEQVKMNMTSILARVGFTPECKEFYG